MPFPFDKYDQLFVPEYNAGAMENAGAVTFTETYVFRSKVTDAMQGAPGRHDPARARAHVVRRPRDDEVVERPLAERVVRRVRLRRSPPPRRPSGREAWTTFTAMEKNWAYAQDQLPSTHPIVAEIHDLEDVQVNFDGITYAKGASVLKQLVAYVGREPFLAGVGAYFRKHALGNTTLADLLAELEADERPRPRRVERGVARDRGRQHARRRRSRRDDGGVDHRASTIVQTAAADYPTIRPHRLAVGFYELHDGRAGAHRAVRARRRRASAPTCPSWSASAAPALVLAQRRRPRLREDPARRGVARDRDRRTSRDRDAARPLARLERGLGRDARRRGAPARLRAARARQRRQPRPSRRRSAPC